MMYLYLPKSTGSSVRYQAEILHKCIGKHPQERYNLNLQKYTISSITLNNFYFDDDVSELTPFSSLKYGDMANNQKVSSGPKRGPVINL